MSEEKKVEDAPERQDKKKSMLPIIIIALLLAIMASTGAGTYFTLTRCGNNAAVTTVATEEEDAEKDTEENKPPVKEAYYFSLDPAFIVNFSGKDKGGFLQVSIDGLTRDSSIKEEVTRHLPQIRSSIVLLLSRQEYSDLVLPEGKEALRKEILTSIQGILKNETGNKGVENIYFTNFVMQ